MIDNDRLQELARSEGMLKTLVADPRQRLAKLLKSSSSPGRNNVKQDYHQAEATPQQGYDDVDDEDDQDYHPTDYMEGLDMISKEQQQNRSTAGLEYSNEESRGETTPDAVEPGVDSLQEQQQQRDTTTTALTMEWDEYQSTSSPQVDNQWASEEEIEKAMQKEMEEAMKYIYPDGDEQYEDDNDEEDDDGDLADNAEDDANYYSNEHEVDVVNEQEEYGGERRGRTNSRGSLPE